ncbi:MAG: hypothetical protein JWM26_2020 [Betaproteobacteria bacterium]|nr:hypothetical protein [Betaproteobacteria bacterium]
MKGLREEVTLQYCRYIPNVQRFSFRMNALAAFDDRRWDGVGTEQRVELLRKGSEPLDVEVQVSRVGAASQLLTEPFADRIAHSLLIEPGRERVAQRVRRPLEPGHCCELVPLVAHREYRHFSPASVNMYFGWRTVAFLTSASTVRAVLLSGSRTRLPSSSLLWQARLIVVKPVRLEAHDVDPEPGGEGEREYLSQLVEQHC